ncbi:hypothetical protein LCM10_01885 [Rossellomorea aquimaris]|uniref:hypothetical protein n=1 Tax=Rossellomorea aquimaris TaxID=189382 RepID=UPI001CD3EB06|nr:hypothetical protein [Rossellomorea aquimaris]MCA1053721.1 hypothetical protein [Rossellomorea aquimaris]
MSFDTIVRMLKTQLDFKESEIIHTFYAKDQQPVLSVEYLYISEVFLITYLRTNETIEYTEINIIADIIDRYLNEYPQEV